MKNLIVIIMIFPVFAACKKDTDSLSPDDRAAVNGLRLAYQSAKANKDSLAFCHDSTLVCDSFITHHFDQWFHHHDSLFDYHHGHYSHAHDGGDHHHDAHGLHHHGGGGHHHGDDSHHGDDHARMDSLRNKHHLFHS